MHFSLHADPNHWHVYVKLAPDQVQRSPWPKPALLAPGLTRALEILTPPAAIDASDPSRPRGVEWVTALPDRWLSFDLFIEEPSVSLASWPGKTSMGSSLVGRLSLSDGTRACVVAWAAPPNEGSM
jgi:hypothetical protein